MEANSISTVRSAPLPVAELPARRVAVVRVPDASPQDVSEAAATSLLAERERPRQSTAAGALAPPSGLRRLAKGDLSVLKRLLPDGYGVTVWLAGESQPHRFRRGTDAERFIQAAQKGSLAEVVFYGHGSPGMMQIEDGYALDAGRLAGLLKDRMQPRGAVHLVGCNTASSGTRAREEGESPLGTAFFGLSALTRRLMYFSLQVVAGGADKKVVESMWDEDLAGSLSDMLPGVYVVGNRTFGFPVDRLVPGSTNVTPAIDLLARRGVYLDGTALRENQAPPRRR